MVSKAKLAMGAAALMAAFSPVSVQAGGADDTALRSNAVLMAAFGGPDEAIRAVPDRQLDELRGGAGLIFSGSFMGEVTGPTTTDLPPGYTLTPSGPNSVMLTSAFGSFNDFSGFLQLANVVGDLNTVNNILNLNVTFTNAVNAAGSLPFATIR